MATASQEALLSLAKAAIAAPPADPGVTEVSVSPPIPWSRREQLFAIAAELFAREGYLAVGINDIGAQAGIAGPSIYRYFTAKAGILSALVNRFCEWATLETARALSCSKDRPAADVVRELAAGYIRLCVEWTDLASVMVTEVINLDPDEARLVERIRSDLESVWVDQVVRARPELEHATAERLVKVAMVMIEDTVRVHHLRTKPGFVGELLALAVGVLVGAPVGHVVAH